MDEPVLQSTEDLTPTQVRRELEVRGAQPVGIFEQDCAVLDGFFQEEFQIAKEEYWKEQRRIAKEREEEEGRIQAEKKQRRLEAEDAEELVTNGPLALLVDLLRKNQTNKEARLIGNPRVARNVARVLPLNSSLFALDLSGGSVGDEGLKALSKSIADPSCNLKRLDLNRSQIGPGEIAFLGEALANASSLHSLSLENNNLTDDGQDLSGAEVFFSSLARNDVLRFVNMTRCCLGIAGTSLAAKSMTVNTAVVAFMMDFNGNQHENDVKTILDRIGANRNACEEQEQKINETKLKELRVRHETAKALSQEDAEREAQRCAEEESRQRWAARMAEYEDRKVAEEKAIEEGMVRAAERQAAFDAKKKKGKKK